MVHKILFKAKSMKRNAEFFDILLSVFYSIDMFQTEEAVGVVNAFVGFKATP